MDIKEIEKEIQSKNDVTTRILKDIILDFKKVCKKQRIIIAILLFAVLICIMYFIFSKI